MDTFELHSPIQRLPTTSRQPTASVSTFPLSLGLEFGHFPLAMPLEGSKKQPSWAERVAATTGDNTGRRRGTRPPVTLKRPNTVRFNARNIPSLQPKEVHDAIVEEIETTTTIKCIASLDSGWYNVTFDNQHDCESVARSGIIVRNGIVACERANILNSVVVYVKAPFEMTDAMIINAIMEFGTATNIRRQTHEFNKAIETGVRSLLVRNLKKPIPSYIKISGFNLPVRHRGQEPTCRICNQTGHFARDCNHRGKCLKCGSRAHQAAWHNEDEAINQNEEKENTNEDTDQAEEEDDANEIEDNDANEMEHNEKVAEEEGFWVEPKKRKNRDDDDAENGHKIPREHEQMEVVEETGDQTPQTATKQRRRRKSWEKACQQLQSSQPPKPSHSTQPSQTDLPTHTDHTDQPILPDQPSQTDQPTQTDKSTQPNQPNQPDMSTQPDQPTQNDQPTQTDQPILTDQPIQPDQPTQHDQSIQPDQADNCDQPTQLDQTQPDHQAQPSKTSKMSQASQSGQRSRPKKARARGLLTQTAADSQKTANQEPPEEPFQPVKARGKGRQATKT